MERFNFQLIEKMAIILQKNIKNNKNKKNFLPRNVPYHQVRYIWGM